MAQRSLFILGLLVVAACSSPVPSSPEQKLCTIPPFDEAQEKSSLGEVRHSVQDQSGFYFGSSIREFWIDSVWALDPDGFSFRWKAHVDYCTHLLLTAHDVLCVGYEDITAFRKEDGVSRSLIASEHHSHTRDQDWFIQVRLVGGFLVVLKTDETISVLDVDTGETISTIDKVPGAYPFRINTRPLDHFEVGRNKDFFCRFSPVFGLYSEPITKTSYHPSTAYEARCYSPRGALLWSERVESGPPLALPRQQIGARYILFSSRPERGPAHTVVLDSTDGHKVVDLPVSVSALVEGGDGQLLALLGVVPDENIQLLDPKSGAVLWSIK